MQKIYLKNFRGFKEQIIELEDVNFLVGENSTGKTSLINLLNILSSQEFWFNNQFNNSEIELGYFDEIISKNSTGKTFQIATERTDSRFHGKNRIDRTLRILFEFKAEKSVPKINWFKFSIDDLNIYVKPSAKYLECLYNTETKLSFKRWTTITEKTKGKKIKINLPFPRFPTPILIRIIIDSIKEDLKQNIENIDFDESTFYRRYTWLAPIRAKAKRIYESYNIKFSPEGEHIPQLLKSLLSTTKKKQKTIEILTKFGIASNLFDSLQINELGDKNASPFEILIKYNDIQIKLPNVGYGVSQILPLIVEILARKKTFFSIQQPEVHLHPKAQAAFGHFLFDSCINDDNSFIIETHSDFTINRFRYCLSKNLTKKQVTSQVLFFERKKDGNEITHIKINNEGTYAKELPIEYRNFFIDEELRLLEL